MKPGFQIKYEIKDSKVKGIGMGVYTLEFIPAGLLIWKYVQNINVRIYKNQEEVKNRLSQLNPDEQNFFLSHVYSFKGMMNEILDDGKFWNHSDSPNTGYGPENIHLDIFSSYALRDIHAGEELFDDYGYYEYPDYFLALAKEYSVGMDFFSVREPRKFQMTSMAI